MKLVLIDRDGVINEEIPGYVKSPEELAIMPQALDALALFKKAGFTCVVITNQSVVGRGIITADALDGIHDVLKKAAEKKGGCIAEVLSCHDHPNRATDRRKPGPGMLFEAMEKYNATPQETIFIGDALTDLEAAYRAGCRRCLVMTGKGRETARHIPEYLQPVMICTDMLDAARKIARKGSRC